ncbi:MAG: superoxide dismutase family protein [Planctomycetaceae bacterium]
MWKQQFFSILLLTALRTSTAYCDDHARHDAGAHSPLPTAGIALMVPMEDSDVKGLLHLKKKDGYVHVTGEIMGLEPGQHGFHIHEYGDLSDRQGKSAGGHFNPDGHPHGGPDDEQRHVGDLGNITANEDGVARVDVKAEGLKLHFVIGRSFVVHAKADDLKSQPSGDAGPRKAVGVIGIAKPNDEEHSAG